MYTSSITCSCLHMPLSLGLSPANLVTPLDGVKPALLILHHLLVFAGKDVAVSTVGRLAQRSGWSFGPLLCGPVARVTVLVVKG